MVNSNNIHVKCTGDKWVIMQEGNDDVLHIADSISAAVMSARAARKGDAAIIVHNKLA